MMLHPHLTHTNHLRFATVILAVLASAASFSLGACAEASEAGAPAGPDGSVLPPSDAGEEASVSEGGDAADDAHGEQPEVPCAVGNLCRVPTPLTFGAVSAMSGRSKDDVWAAASRGLMMRWDGQKWSDLGSTEVPENLTALSSIFLTADEAWGVAGTKVVRRGIDPDSLRAFETNDFFHTPTSIVVLGTGEAYFGCSAPGIIDLPPAWDLDPGGLMKITDFDNGWFEEAPKPILLANNQPQFMNIRAMFLVPDKALWLVGEHAAVARYPVSPLGEGVMLPIALQKDLFAAWGEGEHLWAAGEGGTIIHYDGTEWHVEESGTSASLNAIFGFSESDIWAAGSGGTVLHFDGRTWSSVSIQNYHDDLRAIWGAAPDDVWIGGERGMFHWGALP